MIPDPKLSTEPIPLMRVAVIGGTGDGGAPLTTGTIAQTPDHQPNLVLKVISPLLAISLRFVNNFGATLISLIGAGMTTNLIPAADFYHLVLKCAALSVAGAGVQALKDILTVFSGLERKYPLLTGSV